MKVDTKHKLYGSLEVKRELFRAVKGGTDAIQAKSDTYLPKFPAEDPKEYDARLKASTIDGIVANGVDTLTGAVFFDEINVDAVAPAIKPLLDNIDNKGNKFEVFARDAFEAAFDGSAVIVIDRPNPSGVTIRSAEDERVNNIRTYWRLYHAADVINWRYGVDPVSKATRLELIVLSEPVDEIVNRFETKTVQKYRVYFLEGGVKWELWRKVEKQIDGGEFILEDQGALPQYTGLPIAVVGCLEDEPRLLTESHLEVKAYQKESSFDVIEYLSVPIFYTIGYDKANSGDIAFGASTHVDIPAAQGAAVGFAQIDSAGHMSLKDTINLTKEYIKGRLNELTTSAMSADKTATQTMVEDRDKQSRLLMWAEQLQDALQTALGYTAESMGMKFADGGEIELMTKWAAAAEAKKALDAQPTPFQKAA